MDFESVEFAADPVDEFLAVVAPTDVQFLGPKGAKCFVLRSYGDQKSKNKVAMSEVLDLQQGTRVLP